MISRLRAVSIVVRITIISAVALVAMAAVLTAVVKGTVEASFTEELEAQVISANNFGRHVAEQKGKPAIADGKLAFGSWPANETCPPLTLSKSRRARRQLCSNSLMASSCG